MEARLARLSLTSEAGKGERRWGARTGREPGLRSRTGGQAENGQDSSPWHWQHCSSERRSGGRSSLPAGAGGDSPGIRAEDQTSPHVPRSKPPERGRDPLRFCEGGGGRTLQGSGTWRSRLAGTQEGTVSEAAPRGRGGSKRRRTGCGPLPGRPNLPRSSDTVVSNVDGKMHLGHLWR